MRGLGKRIGLCVDVAHTLRTGADPVQSAGKSADRLQEVRIQGVRAATAKGTRVEVGRGVIDTPGFLRALLKINDRGMVACEHEKDENHRLAVKRSGPR